MFGQQLKQDAAESSLPVQHGAIKKLPVSPKSMNKTGALQKGGQSDKPAPTPNIQPVVAQMIQQMVPPMVMMIVKQMLSQEQTDEQGQQGMVPPPGGMPAAPQGPGGPPLQ